MKSSILISVITLLIHSTLAQAADEAKLNRDDPEMTRRPRGFVIGREKIGLTSVDQCTISISSGSIESTRELIRQQNNNPIYLKFSRPPNKNEEITIKGSSGRAEGEYYQGCEIRGTLTINHIILLQWADSSIDEKCLVAGHNYYGIKNIDAEISSNKYLKEDSELLIPISSDLGRKIVSSCQLISRAEEILSTPTPCRINENGRETASKCNGYLVDTSDGSVALPLAEAFTRLMDGKPVELKEVEAEQSRKERLARMAEIEEQRRLALAADEAKKRAEEVERQRIENERAEKAKAQEEREKWLNSPAGKRYLAEEAAKQKRAEEEAKKQLLAERRRIAKEYPYYALISCEIQGMHMSIYNCLFNEHIKTTIKLRNGEQEDIFQIYDVARLGKETSDGLKVRLRRSFALQTQNASEHFIMGVKIFDAINENILFQRKSSKYERIAVKN